MRKKFLLKLFLLIFVHQLHADSGAWLSSWVDLFWDNSANWSGATFPSGAGDVAAFIGQQPGTQNIDSTQDITLNSLHFDAPGRSLFISFTNNNLIFDSNGSQDQSNIFIAKEQTHFINTPIILLSDLAIHAGTSASLYLNAPISGDHSLSIFVDPNTHINSNIGHTYTGDTIIQSGWLDLNGPGSATNVPGDIIVQGSGSLKHDAAVFNNYGASSKMFINGGEVDLNGTTQTISSLDMAKRGLIRGNLGSTLVLSSNILALKMREDSLIMVDNIIIENGGAITNDPGAPGNGYILGFVAPQGYTDIDLSGNTVAINANQGGYEPTRDITLDFADVHFTNGALLKTGTGRIIMEGCGSLPSLAILGGGLQIGRAHSPATLDSDGIIIIDSATYLSGFGKLGNDGNASLINRGYLIPGDYSEQGKFTISGDYEQKAGGSLLIQGMSESNVSSLIVTDGNVTLSGIVYFSALAGASFHPGDEVVLIENIGGNISGSFFQLQANLPQGLTASLSYTAHKVIMTISACN